MSGAGSGVAGAGSAGIEGAPPTANLSSFLPYALRFEGSSRNWRVNPDSNFAGVTPNEQAVALSLSVRQGTLRHSPSTGNTLHEIVYLGATNLGSDITDRVNKSNPIARLISENAISIDRIEYQTYTSGGQGPKNRLAVAVYFRDLETDPNRIIPVTWET